MALYVRLINKMQEITIHIHFPPDAGVVHRLEELLGLARETLKREIHMGTQLDDFIKTVNDATNAIGTVVSSEAQTIQQVSDNQDKLLAQLAAGTPVTADQIAAMQAQADHLSLVKASLDEQAATLAGVASKGASNPLPVPVVTETAPDAPNPTP